MQFVTDCTNFQSLCPGEARSFLSFDRPTGRVRNVIAVQLAGGGVGSADTYARLFRKLLDGQLRLGSMLRSSAVCANPATCGTDKALYTPMPQDEDWLYSLGHWVEADPLVGDGAFSSLGLWLLPLDRRGARLLRRPGPRLCTERCSPVGALWSPDTQGLGHERGAVDTGSGPAPGPPAVRSRCGAAENQADICASALVVAGQVVPPFGVAGR